MQSEFGKFGSADELLTGYRALEAEFTKRCQKLSALQQEIALLKEKVQQDETEREEWGKSAEAVLKDREREAVRQALLQAKEIVEEQQRKCDERIWQTVNSKEWKDKVIEEYLTSLRAGEFPVLLSSQVGTPSLTPTKKPQTLQEAKRLADYLLARS